MGCTAAAKTTTLISKFRGHRKEPHYRGVGPAIGNFPIESYLLIFPLVIVPRAFLSHPKLPFPFLSNAYHAGYKLIVIPEPLLSVYPDHHFPFFIRKCFSQSSKSSSKAVEFFFTNVVLAELFQEFGPFSSDFAFERVKY